MNSLQSVALARIRLGDAQTALQSASNSLEDALRVIREKFPDIHNQPHDRPPSIRSTAFERTLSGKRGGVNSRRLA